MEIKTLNSNYNEPRKNVQNNNDISRIFGLPILP